MKTFFISLIGIAVVSTISVPARGTIFKPPLISVQRPVALNDDATYDSLLPSGNTWRTIMQIQTLVRNSQPEMRARFTHLLGIVWGRYVAQVLDEKTAIEEMIANYGKKDFTSPIEVLNEMTEEMLSIELMIRASRLGLAHVYLNENATSIPFKGGYFNWVTASRKAFLEGFWNGLRGNESPALRAQYTDRESFAAHLKSIADDTQDCAITIQDEMGKSSRD